MNGISHKQAIKWIYRRLDGLLTENQTLLLDQHLDSCDTCRAYAAEIDLLPAHLQSQFHARWDEQPGPSQNVIDYVTTKARRIPLTNRLSSGLKLMSGLATLVALAFLINLVVSQLRDTSSATVDGEIATSPPLVESRLLAFTSDQNGNSDIYTIHPDGSGMTNLTNHPSKDSNPIWSPDGTRIAFESDRNGFIQVYLMNADGSNVIQLTHDEANHFLPLNMYGESNPWSPDGNKLLFIQQMPEAETSTLYSVDIINEDVVTLASATVLFHYVSWSPDGKYVGYVLNDSPTPDATFEANIYIVDVMGSNLFATKALLPQTDSVYSPFYYWSRNGSSIVFIVYRHLDETSHQWIAYEAAVESQQLIERATSSTVMGDWWEGTSFVYGTDLHTLTWLRADGTFDTFKPFEICDLTVEAQHSFLANRSPNGSQVINVACPNKEMWFYYANSDGTIIKPLMDSAIPSFGVDNIVTSLTWSSDDQFIAATQVSPTKSSLYILDVREPPAQPVEIIISDGEFYTIPSWRPVSNREVAQEKPTPEPTQAYSNTNLIAFTAAGANHELDIYTVRTDGSEETNLTNDSARDTSPVWSPDGKRIAFISNRDGNENIYVMNADGSDLMQLTDDPAPDTDPIWSPDGTKIAYYSGGLIQDDVMIHVVDSNGQNHRRLNSYVNIPRPLWPIAWTPNSQFIVFYYGSEIVQTLEDPDTLAEMGRIFIKVGVYTNGFGEPVGDFTTYAQDMLGSFTLSQDGSTLFYLAQCSENSAEFCRMIKTIDQYGLKAESHATVQPQETCASSDGNQQAKWSPDRTKILFAFYCEGKGGSFYIANADGSEFKPLTNDPVLFAGPGFDWSTDSQLIVFTSVLESAGDENLYILNINDALQNPQLRPSPLSISAPQISSPAWQPATIAVSHNEPVEEQPTPQPTQAAVSEHLPPIGTGISNGEWIAFIGVTMVPDPTFPPALTDPKDVYLMHPDGTGLVNITNSPDAYFWAEWSPSGKDLLFLRSADTVDILRKTETNGFEVLVSTAMSTEVNVEQDIPEQPFTYRWSPNSEQIAFLDNRAGNSDIYTIYADGRDDTQLKQLTNDPGEEFGFVWSPDGSQIAYQKTDREQLSIMVMNADGSNQHEVARGAGQVSLRWSMDGKSIYASSMFGWPPYGFLACEGCVTEPAIYQIDLDRASVRQIYYDEEAEYGWDLYDTPQNGLYFMRIDFDQPSLGIWGAWKYWDGNSIHEIGEMDPQQTCETATGNILNEYIAPNKRFSIITNFCAGMFDLYLADREATTPEGRLIHLLQLPSETVGEGPNEAWLPVGWSPDGRLLIYKNGRRATYFVDIEKAIQDSSTALAPFMEPITYAGADGLQYPSPETITIWSLAWQPAP
ncbi:MAG TPA: zf-HC2 domain-containing protein [Anaerolineales bacterium]|nr:zf-HC2 domain-containing protein [Anaerolineales bacterium]